MRVSFRLALVALLENESVAPAVPLDCGVNTIVIGTLCPAVTVNGNEIPLSLNSDVVTLADDTVTFDPVALRFAVSDLF